MLASHTASVINRACNLHYETFPYSYVRLAVSLAKLKY